MDRTLVPVCALYKEVSAILPAAIGTEPSNHHLVAVLGETAAPRCFENTVFLVTAKISVDLRNPGTVINWHPRKLKRC